MAPGNKVILTKNNSEQPTELDLLRQKIKYYIGMVNMLTLDNLCLIEHIKDLNSRPDCFCKSWKFIKCPLCLTESKFFKAYCESTCPICKFETQVCFLSCGHCCCETCVKGINDTASMSYNDDDDIAFASDSD